MRRHESTTIDMLIKALEECREKWGGDIPVFVRGESRSTAKLHLNPIPYYYDGGATLPLQSTGYHCKEWVGSRYLKGKYPDEAPDFLLQIRADEPVGAHNSYEGDMLNGVRLPSYIEDDGHECGVDTPIAGIPLDRRSLLHTLELMVQVLSCHTSEDPAMQQIQSDALQEGRRMISRLLDDREVTTAPSPVKEGGP